MKTETKKDMVAFGRMIAGIVLLFSWWFAVLCICTNMDCGCCLPNEIGGVPIDMFGAMLAIPGSYLMARIGGRLQAVWGLVAACLLWPLWFLDCFMWVLGDGHNACCGEYFCVGISILFGIEVLAAFYFTWRKFVALRRGGFSVCCAAAAMALATLGLVGCKDDGWRVTVTRIESVPLAPPAELLTGTNYPYASITCSIEDPVNPGMDPEKFSAFQKCLGKSICPHSRRVVTSVRDGLDAALFEFWDKYLKEVRQGTFSSEFAILEISTRVAYTDPEYVGYVVEYQDGCPCCLGQTNVVWSWERGRSLTSADIVRTDPASVAQLRMMLRAAVKRYFADSYGDEPEAVLPDCAKDWPHALENFLVDERGMSWTCDAGEVLFGGKGACSFLLTWEELSPVLREDFRLPAKTAPNLQDSKTPRSESN